MHSKMGGTGQAVVEARRPLGIARLLRSPWALQLAATAIFVSLVAWRVDVAQAVGPLREADYFWTLLAFGVFFLERVIDTIRWRVYLTKVGWVPLPGLLGAFLIGNLGNNLLPMRAGDIAKIQIVANRYGLSRAGLASTVFMVENVMDGLTFLILLLIGLALLDVAFVPAPLLWGLAASAGGGFIATTIVSRFFPRQFPAWRWLLVLPPPVSEGLARSWPKFLDGLETMRSVRLLTQTVALNFAGWLTQALMFWMFGRAFGLDLSLASYIVIMVAANLIAAFPITFQSLGTYEVVLLEILVAWGVQREDAFAFAAATHIVTNLWVVALGLVSLRVMKVRPGEVFAFQERPPGEGSRTDEPRAPARRR